MSIRTVNALSHYTDWTIGHVHSGALGWVAMISFGSLYYLIPRLYGREKMHSVKAIELHFWIATIGVVLYIAAMWIAGVQQGLMWRDTAADGTLVYSFVEELKTRVPYYLIRLLGGTLFLSGVFVMAWNVWMTVRRDRGQPRHSPGRSASRAHAGHRRRSGYRLTRTSWPTSNTAFSHQTLEKNIGWMIIASILVVSFAGADHPAVLPAQHHAGGRGRRALQPLRLMGRDIYIREGCVGCHSQQVRLLAAEVQRYGSYSLASESVFDHPFLWGSKRTGPDRRAWASAIPTSGTASTCATRAWWCRSPTCRPIRGWRRPRSPARTCRTACAPCAWWACRTATRKSPPRPRPSRARRKRTRWWPTCKGWAWACARRSRPRRPPPPRKPPRRPSTPPAAGRPAGLGRLIMAYISASSPPSRWQPFRHRLVGLLARPPERQQRIGDAAVRAAR